MKDYLFIFMIFFVADFLPDSIVGDDEPGAVSTQSQTIEDIGLDDFTARMVAIMQDIQKHTRFYNSRGKIDNCAGSDVGSLEDIKIFRVLVEVCFS